ncbi:MAG: O-antigen polysaccharide polymerase Wzy [Elusimicrobiota bacterium]
MNNAVTNIRFSRLPQRPIEGRAFQVWFGYFLLSLILIPILRYVTRPDVSIVQQGLAYLVVLVCLLPSVIHLAKRQPGVPVFPIICLVYAASYALPAFYAEPLVESSWGGGILIVPARYTERALRLTLAGIIALECGFWFFRFSILNLLVPKVRLTLEAVRAQPLATVMGITGSALLWLGLTERVVIPPRLFAVYGLMIKLSLLGFGLLYWYFLKGNLRWWGRLAYVVIFAILVMLGMAMGNVRNLLDPILIVTSVNWMARKKFPWHFAMIGVLFFAFIQPIKGEYRNMVWKQGMASTSIFDRIAIWSTLSVTSWNDLLHGRRSVQSSTRSSIQRTDCIHLFGHVLTMTPRHVPFQLGKTYDYFIYTLIPRAIWPKKPNAQVANEFFGVAYGLQDPASIGTTSIGMPHLVESYVNFGALGVLFIMGILGMVYATMERLFNHENAGEGGIAIFAVILTSLINIETALAPSFGSILQSIIIYIVALRWVRERRANP